MIDIECLDSSYSTTRLLMHEKPIMEKKTDDMFETTFFLPKGEGRKDEGGLRTKGYFKKTFEDKPLISIITVVFNGEKHLEQTIQSVLQQTYDNVEYIILDGGSTDGTCDIIKKYENQIDYWVSGKDAGLYDAMNRGVKLVFGDFVNFLNADDTIYVKDAVENIVKHIDEMDNVFFSRAHVISETVSWFYPDMKVADMNKWLKWNLPNHQTMFFPKSFYKEHLYDTRLNIGADDDYKLFALNHKNVKFIDLTYVEFKRGGVSSNHRSVNLLIQRVKESYIKNFKHKRWIRFVIDPFKLVLMFLINLLFGKENFSRFIKTIVKLKS